MVTLLDVVATVRVIASGRKKKKKRRRKRTRKLIAENCVSE